MSGGSNNFPVVDVSGDDFPVVDVSNSPPGSPEVVYVSDSPPKGEGGAAKDDGRAEVVYVSDSPPKGEGGAGKDDGRGEGGAAGADKERDLRPCAICHGEMPGGKPVTFLECGHVFHSHCATMILVHNGSDEDLCPVCKKEYKFKERTADLP